MSKKLKLSPWHDEKVRPVHPGYYQCLNYLEREYFSEWYCFWNGYDWFAETENGLRRLWHQNVFWRGILK